MTTNSPIEPRAPRTVLIVEDEPTLRGMLLKALPDMDFACDAAASGEAALRMLADKPYTVLILDLNLPGMHGMEVFERVREGWPGMSVVILTGYGTLAAAKDAIRLDVVDFLTKPCPLGEIERALDHAYRRHLLVNAAPDKLLPQPAAPAPIEPASQRDELNLHDVERDVIIEALNRTEGNRAEAALLLGISDRKLYYRLAHYKLRES